MKKVFLFVVLLFCMVSLFSQKSYSPNWESLDSRPVEPWFSDAKLGVYLHVGPSNVPAWTPKGTYSEWYQYWLHSKGIFGNGDLKGPEVSNHHLRIYGEDVSYYDFGEMFKAKHFDADRIVNMLEKTGVKYAIISSKHHDGYCIWPSKQANETWGRKWNSVDIGPKRDLMGEMATALKKSDIKFGAYYSLYEWYNPLWIEDPEKFAIEHMHPQFKDLVESYKPDLIWADGEWDMESDKWDSPELLTWLFNESSVKDNVVVNDRWGKETRLKHGGYYTTEYESGMKAANHPWEECRGLGFSFGYSKEEDSWDYSSVRTLIYLLANTVSNGGNLLLAISTDSDGYIPPIMQDRMIGLGDWLKVNGEAIYGTRRWERSCQWSEGKRDWMPKKQVYLTSDYIIKQTVEQQPGYAVREVFFTQKENCVYAIVPKFPREELVIKNFKIKKGAKVTMLGMDLELKYKQAGDDLIVKVPTVNVDDLPCLYAWTIKIENR